MLCAEWREIHGSAGWVGSARDEAMVGRFSIPLLGVRCATNRREVVCIHMVDIPIGQTVIICEGFDVKDGSLCVGCR